MERLSKLQREILQLMKKEKVVWNLVEDLSKKYHSQSIYRCIQNLVEKGLIIRVCLNPYSPWRTPRHLEFTDAVSRVFNIKKTSSTREK